MLNYFMQERFGEGHAMTLERIAEHNLDYAVQIQSELFPGESARTNYEESLAEPSAYEY